MTTRPSLEEAVRAALLQHAEDAELPLTEAHVRAQATVAVRAAQAWSATHSVHTLEEFPPLRTRAPYPPKPVPGTDAPPPAHPTPAGTHCTRPTCEPIERAVGWRWYLAHGWQPACDRHMGGATRATRRYNTEYTAVAE